MMNILVIDSNPNRAASFVSNISGLGHVVHVVSYNGVSWDIWHGLGLTPLSVAELTSYEIVFWHLGDYVINSRPVVTSLKTVFYGGNAWPDSHRLASHLHEFLINRPIVSANEVLTADELKALFAFINGVTRDRPDFLGEPPARIALVALAILCQGYLLAHARKHAECRRLLAISEDEFAQLAPQLPESALLESEKPENWTLNVESPEKMLSMVTAEYRGKGSVAPISGLITQMFSFQNIELPVVMSAYPVIKDEVSR